MQASRDWEPPSGTLGKILDETRRRIPSLERLAEVVGGGGKVPREQSRSQLRPPSLKDALRRDTIAIIAEIKRRSPSKGALNESLDAGAQAQAYARGGAAAISVLTEPAFFGGSLEDLIDVAVAVPLPLLKKDFVIDRLQLAEAIDGQASAVLLIARAIPPAELPVIMDAVREARLEAVVEVRSEDELDRAVDAGAEIVGVNSRDLETLEVDERVPRRLIPLIPGHVVGIWESGVQSVEDVRRAADCGADAVLVGSILSRSADAEALVRSFAAVPRQARHA